MSTPLYSIIIPHHNIPKLLTRCLASIPQRDDTEIIVVDDNSDPNKVDFDHFPGAERKDVKIILDKQGGGAGHARNIALGIASGRWIIFADADDFFNYCIADVMDNYADSDADIVYFPAISLDTDKYTPSWRANHLMRFINTYRKNRARGESLLRYMFGEPWCRIVRRELLVRNKILFDKTIVHEDTMIAYLSGYYAKTIEVDDRALYCVTERQGSLSSSINEAKVLAAVGILARRERFLREHGVWTHDKFNEYPYKYLLYALLRDKDLYRRALKVFTTEGFTEFHAWLGMVTPIIKLTVSKALFINRYKLV